MPAHMRACTVNMHKGAAAWGVVLISRQERKLTTTSSPLRKLAGCGGDALVIWPAPRSLLPPGSSQPVFHSLPTHSGTHSASPVKMGTKAACSSGNEPSASSVASFTLPLAPPLVPTKYSRPSFQLCGTDDPTNSIASRLLSTPSLCTTSNWRCRMPLTVPPPRSKSN
jgi:hypothetical protein